MLGGKKPYVLAALVQSGVSLSMSREGEKEKDLGPNTTDVHLFLLNFYRTLLNSCLFISCMSLGSFSENLHSCFVVAIVVIILIIFTSFTWEQVHGASHGICQKLVSLVNPF